MTWASTAATWAQSVPSRQLHAPKHSPSAKATLTVKLRFPSVTLASISWSVALVSLSTTPRRAKMASPRDTSVEESLARAAAAAGEEASTQVR